MTPTQHQLIIKKLNFLIFLGVLICLSYLLGFWMTMEHIHLSTKKIITYQGLTLGKLNSITTTLQICEESISEDIDIEIHIQEEIKGYHNKFPSKKEMLEELNDETQ